MTWHLLLISFVLTVSANELSRCCGGGSRHFQQTGTCSNIRSEGTSMNCVRSASICCLRSLLDNACTEGAASARSDDSCPSNINVLAGGIRKECCDCCLLAKEIVRRNEPCVPPTGFSAACLNAFSRCCNVPFTFTEPHHRITDTPLADGAILHLGDRCAQSKCDHLCNDRGGDSVECSCRAGFELGPDGSTCVDKNECLSASPCRPREKCINTDGGFRCQPIRRPPRMRDDPRRRPERRLGDAPRPCTRGFVLRGDQCVDVDECNLGSHDCGPLYQCRNTQGSYRCDPKKCGEGELQNPRTGECTSIDCPLGFVPKNGMCIDVDECASSDRCGAAQQCVNTPGSYRCQDLSNLCADGYQTNKHTGFCEDIDECASKVCGQLQCINLPGSYKCRCPAGYDFNENTKKCEDVDECAKFAGHVCDVSAECLNTVGSFFCKCKKGFKLATDGRHCEDVDECSTGIAKCEQKCVNIPGSYQCICDRGFALDPDGTTCQDIDECAVWSGSGSDLCMGGCINTRGSYICQCPPGYKIQPDGRTCVDVDECALGECQGHDRICVNTLGHFKCHHVECPANYVHDSNYKNSVQDGYSCLKRCGEEDAGCLANNTREILYQFRAVPSMTILAHPLEVSRIRAHMDIPFSVDYSLDTAGQRHFEIEQDRNIGIVRLIRPLEGPSTERIRVHLNTKSRTGVVLAYNVAVIEVHVSRYPF